MKDIIREDDISTLPMSKRLYNCLKRTRINTIGDMLRYAEEDDWMRITNMGKGTAAEADAWAAQLRAGDGEYRLVIAEDGAHTQAQDGRQSVATLFLRRDGRLAEDISIEELNLGIRARHVLVNSEILRASQLIGMKEKALLALPGMGKHSVQEVLDALRRARRCAHPFQRGWRNRLPGAR